MTYAIIGSGAVGSALAGHFARHGIAAGIANTRGPGSIAAPAGASVVPMPLDEALEADVIVLAVPYGAYRAVAARRPDWRGKIVVDAMNAFGVAPESLGGRPSSEHVAAAFEGARLVKTFNQLPAKLLAADPADAGGRRVMFVAGNDAAANAEATRLVEALGFAPIGLGRLDEGGALLGTAGPLILHNLVKLG